MTDIKPKDQFTADMGDGMLIEVFKTEPPNGKWTVRFGYKFQSFYLEQYGNTKREAMWIASMLRKCFENYKGSLLKSLSNDK